MRLADHFLAAVDTPCDVGGFAAAMAPLIREAQRFEVADEVAQAAGELIQSRPSTLLAALPLCRLPYETMWLEYRGGMGPAGAKPRAFDHAPVPWKQGVLIEGMRGTTGFMTFGWMHSENSEQRRGALLRQMVGNHPVNISPLSVYFDWRADGSVREVVRLAHEMLIKHLAGKPAVQAIIDEYCTFIERKWMSDTNMSAINAMFTGRLGWEKLAGDPREIEAMKGLYRHMMPGVSPHGMGLIALLLSKCRTETDMFDFMLRWEADMQGEGGWVQCFLAMLNSRNPVVEHAPVDLGKLNRARKRSGKPQFLPYAKTRLALSRTQARIAKAHGINREAARQHLVRGHFKIRRTGVYWWSPFLRGDAAKGRVQREQYEVVKE